MNTSALLIEVLCQALDMPIESHPMGMQISCSLVIYLTRRNENLLIKKQDNEMEDMKGRVRRASPEG